MGGSLSLSLLQDEISKSIYLRFYIMLFPIPRTVKRCQLDNVIFLHPFSGPIWSLLLNWMVKLGPNKIFMAFSRKLKEKEAGHHQVLNVTSFQNSKPVKCMRVNSAVRHLFHRWVCTRPRLSQTGRVRRHPREHQLFQFS